MRRVIVEMSVSVDRFVVLVKFVHVLSRAGLVDEYRLAINLVALGDGLPLFKDLSAPIKLQLAEATTYPTGEVLHIYAFV